MSISLVRLNDFYANKIQKLSNFSLLRLICLTLVVEISVSLIFSFILFPNHSAGPKFETKSEEFFIAVIFAPLGETLIFQHTIISYFLNKRPNSFLFSCIFSAVLFGASHFYSPEYILKTFFSGLLFGTLYIVVYKKKQNAFIVVAIAHAIYNFIGFCLRQF
jgi:hypothetical protein